MKKLDNDLAMASLGRIVLEPFVDAWVLMLVLGGISHQTGWHTAISYWVAFLLCHAALALIPYGTQSAVYLKAIAEKNGR